MQNGSGPDAGDLSDASAPAEGQPATAQAEGQSGGDDGLDLRASLEAIMLVADEPVSEVVIAQVLERPRAEVAGMLRDRPRPTTRTGAASTCGR